MYDLAAVPAQGMVLVEELLTDGFISPLYLEGRADDVQKVVNRCLVALDGESGPRRGSTSDGFVFGLRQVGSGGSV
jgi:hypothetical protein